MRRMLLGLVVCALMVVPAVGVPTLDFAETTGGWSYNGSGTLSFSPDIEVTKGLGLTTDTLKGAFVFIPDLTVSGGGPYTVSPASVTTIRINSQSDGLGTDYLSGTLGGGDLDPSGEGAGAYTQFSIDITGVTVQNTIGSSALAAINSGVLNLDLRMSGAGQDFANMLAQGLSGSDGFTGSMSVVAVPAPAALLLAGIGTGLVGWLRRRRAV